MKKIGVFKDFTDGSIKTVFQSDNKEIIEMTLLFNKENTDVVCVPTHHFCNLGCKMCHLTNNSLNKTMVPVRIDDFYTSLVETILDPEGKRRTDKKSLKISFMGVGEPLLNLKLIEEVYKLEEEIKKLGYTNICYAISTMMPNNNVLKLMEMVDELNMPMKVHFSLHTSIDENRFMLLPRTQVHVDEALTYLSMYRETLKSNDEIMSKYIQVRSTSDPTEIHYTLIKGINDGDAELSLLCEYLKKYHIPIKFIRFNPTNEMEISENENIWVDTIHREIPDLKIKVYSPPGREIGSSCGEFTKHYYHEEIETEEELEEFNTWKKNHEIEKVRKK